MASTDYFVCLIPITGISFRHLSLKNNFSLDFALFLHNSSYFLLRFYKVLTTWIPVVNSLDINVYITYHVLINLPCFSFIFSFRIYWNIYLNKRFIKILPSFLLGQQLSTVCPNSSRTRQSTKKQTKSSVRSMQLFFFY